MPGAGVQRAAPEPATVEAIVRDFSDGDDSVLAKLTPEVIVSGHARDLLRRTVVRRLVQREAHDQVEAVLKAIIAAYPAAFDEKLLLVRTLSRLGRLEESITVIHELAKAHPTNAKVLTSQLQLYLQTGRVSEAAGIANSIDRCSERPPKLMQLALLALTRAGHNQRALDLARAYRGEMTSEIAALAVAAALAGGHVNEVLRSGHEAISTGLDSPALRVELGRACLARLDYDGAITHLSAGAALNPDHVRVLTMLGETLVIKSRPKAALQYLERAVKLAPQLVHVRAVYARALKAIRDYESAANELLEVVKLDPKELVWKRQAAAALNQAGRRREAARLFEEVITERDAALPKGFNEGFDRLWRQTNDIVLPTPRLDWAWRLRGSSWPEGREIWERRARWGYVADRLIFDWLECRPHRAEEAMWQLADLEETARFLSDATAGGRGLLIASAHVGPMFAGPLALELLSVRSKWLASTPSIAGASYAGALISTSDQTEAQVVRHAIHALDGGYAVVVAVDGAMSMAAPRIIFEGQEITYSAFAARLAYRRGVPSVFAVPQWRKDRLVFHVAGLPDPKPGETMEDFSERWRSAYLRELRAVLSGEPENLRLSGGLWRHIRAMTV